MRTQQMELGFSDARSGRPGVPRSRRTGRASWWFERMRQIVDRAMDWEPAPSPRPEQIWFAGAHRQIEVGAASAGAAGQGHDLESQMCE